LASDELVNEMYGDDFKKHLLEQYKLYVGTAQDVSSKRLESNKFYLSISSVILGIAGYLAAISQPTVIILFSIIGIVISIVWIQSISSYRELNAAKFRVIHKLEESMPARLFKIEEKNYGDKHRGLSSTERWCPIVFLVLYSAVIAITLYLVSFSLA
jgi:hypothetical protein